MMCEAKSQYESRQEVGTGEEPPRDARSRPDWRRHGGRLERRRRRSERGESREITAFASSTAVLPSRPLLLRLVKRGWPQTQP